MSAILRSCFVLCTQHAPLRNRLLVLTSRSFKALQVKSVKKTFVGVFQSRKYVPTSSEYARLTPNQVNSILKLNEVSVEVHQGAVYEVELNQLASNNPVEDRLAEAKLLSPGTFLFGVFDGHAGSACAQAISERLFHYLAVFLTSSEVLEPYANQLKKGKTFDEVKPELVQSFGNAMGNSVESVNVVYKNSLAKLITEMAGTIDDEVSVEGNLISAFMRLDQDLITEALPSTTNTQLNREILEAAFSGACACVAYVNGADLHVANVGDCKAVLGVNLEGDEWRAIELTKDHTANNENEVQRLITSHPNESTSLIIAGRLLGQLIPLRAFGDVRYKWSVKDLKHIEKTSDTNAKFYAYYQDNFIPPHYRTPPYLTAEPEISHHRLTPKDKFLILASDGLWEMLSPDKVVKLVAAHLDGEQVLEEFSPPENLVLREINELLKKRKQSLANRTIDSNVATHLLRNALGPDHAKLSALLSLPSNLVRNYRDDISVSVIFFDTEYLREHPSYE